MNYRSPEETVVRPQSHDTGVAVISYALHMLGAVLALPSIIGLVINYIKRNDGVYPLDSHHAWMISTFWWALLWSIIGALTWFFLIGWAILGLTWLWYLYRHLRGLLRLLDHRPMPA